MFRDKADDAGICAYFKDGNAVTEYFIVNDKFIWRLLFADMHEANVVSECARLF